MYRLVEDESQHEILTAEDIQGFFVDPSLHDSNSLVTMIGSSLRPHKIPVLFEDVELQVRDVQGKEIGAYYVGRAEVQHVKDSESVQNGTDLAVSFFGYGVPYPYGGEIWRTWTQGTPAETGAWKSLPPEAHASWLHVVQTAWFRSGRLAKHHGESTTCEISGSDLANIASFYCELGEAVNGPGGYFGSNLDALEDCLINSGARGKPPFRLSWRDFETSRRNIGEEELDDVISVMREYGIETEYPPVDR